MLIIFLILHRKQDLFFTLKVPLGPIILHAVRTIHLNLRSITRNLWTYQTFFSKKGSVPVTYTFNGKQIFNDSIKDKEISFTSSITQPISKYEIAVVWNTSKDIRRKVSFSFRKMITTHQLSILKKQFQGPTISDVTLSGTKTITLSFVQTGSISECNKDFSALFKNSAMTAKEHFSWLLVEKLIFRIKLHCLSMKMVKNYLVIIFLLRSIQKNLFQCLLHLHTM